MKTWGWGEGQSNSVIAGSPRNAFRCSVVCFLPEVEHWIGDGPYRVTDLSQTPNAGK
ncbi:retrotransposon protein [Streptomyces sp. Mg1]|nr:retrotransposon protein [Streptomyces sp. Mg1]